MRVSEGMDAHGLEAAGVPPWLAELAEGLVRGQSVSVQSYLQTVGVPVTLDGTKATARTHFIVRDVSGRPRVNALAKKLAAQIVEYCIPRSRIEEAKEYLDQYGSAEKFLQLGVEARELFSGLEQSGEGGELLLYFLLEVYLGIPQLLCKMSLKTNPNMHIHGTDGVHASLLGDGTLALYWGESKMHASVTSAIDECFKSIAPYLDGTRHANNRDLLLLRDNLDTGQTEVTQAFVQYFIDDMPQASRTEFRGACLIGFDWNAYPNPFDEDGKTVRDEVAAAIKKWHERLGMRVASHKLDTVSMEVFCVPVPSVQAFRDAIKTELGR